MKKIFALVGLALASLAGCRSYEAKPIVWEDEVKKDGSAERTDEVAFANLDEAVMIAMVGNPELNRLRLKRMNAERTAGETGWWEDPELNVDALRILNPDSHPFLMGTSLSFTIPLSGVPGCEEKAAKCYAGADAEAVRAAERDVAVDVRKAVVRVASLRERMSILEAYDADERIRRALANAEKLLEAGEVSAGDLAAARRRRHGRLHALRKLQREALAEEAVLLKLLGYLPGVTVKVPPAEMHAEHQAHEKSVDPLDLVRHPKVKEAIARLEGGEAALEAEIRRQYPDLKIGPAYEREEGLDRLGVVVGTTLPLWNRNRKGIAEAEGTRDEARFEAIATWRNLVRDYAAARAALENLLDHPHGPASERDQAEKLADAGELGPLDYLSMREELCDLDLEEAEWRAETCAAYEELRRFEVEKVEKGERVEKVEMGEKVEREENLIPDVE